MAACTDAVEGVTALFALFFMEKYGRVPRTVLEYST
jgi:hypothetical protein